MEVDNQSVYYLIKYDRTLIGDNNYTILDTIISLSDPQMCDTNAVSFKSYYSDDSAKLVVAILSPQIKYITLLIYVEGMTRWKTGMTIPSGYVYNLRNY